MGPWIDLVEDDKNQKMKIFIMAMAALRSLGKFTYASWLCHFGEGEGSSLTV